MRELKGIYFDVTLEELGLPKGLLDNLGGDLCLSEDSMIEVVWKDEKNKFVCRSLRSTALRSCKLSLSTPHFSSREDLVKYVGFLKQLIVNDVEYRRRFTTNRFCRVFIRVASQNLHTIKQYHIEVQLGAFMFFLSTSVLSTSEPSNFFTKEWVLSALECGKKWQEKKKVLCETGSLFSIFSPTAVIQSGSNYKCAVSPEDLGLPNEVMRNPGEDLGIKSDDIVVRGDRFFMVVERGNNGFPIPVSFLDRYRASKKGSDESYEDFVKRAFVEDVNFRKALLEEKIGRPGLGSCHLTLASPRLFVILGRLCMRFEMRKTIFPAEKSCASVKRELIKELEARERWRLIKNEILKHNSIFAAFVVPKGKIRRKLNACCVE